MYFITSFAKLPEQLTWGKSLTEEFGSMRTWGFVETLAEAKRLVENNVTDLHETIYKYAVIEELNPGLYPQLDDEGYVFKLYKCNFKKDIFEEIELPDFLKGDCCKRGFTFCGIG